MAELINPFLGFKDPLKKKGHNPYRFNPFTVLGVTKDEIDAESITDKVEEMKFNLASIGVDELTAAEQEELKKIANAQRFLEEPLQRLAFELLIPDKAAEKNEENIQDE